jgi:hypothetical protein
VFGITTGKAHLNVLDSAAIEPEEIQWDGFVAWNNGDKPKFAGRYFLGQPYLWAHGEGSEALQQQIGVERIVPLQRADAARQEATDEEGARYGIEDASAFCEYLDKCIDMGELKITNTFVYVFLEVDNSTVLSTEYWSSWAATIHDHMLVSEKSVTAGNTTVTVPALSWPYLPCICCQFEKAGGSASNYRPEQTVINCLTNAGSNPAGKQTRCYGFWARATDNPAYYVPQPQLDWSAFDSFRQPQGSADQPVWLLLWRYKDISTSDPPDIPQGDKLTLDAANDSAGQAKVSKYMLQLVANRTARLTPTQIGIDRGRASSEAQVQCMPSKAITLNNLPITGVAAGDRAGVPLNPPFIAPPTFFLRYITTPSNDPERGKDALSLQEANRITATGISVVTTWQARAEEADEHLTTPNQGIRDSRLAFSYAAYVLRQPANTPIYFSIDCNVEFLFPTGILPNDVVTYFEDIRRGYLEYLQDQELDLQVVWKNYALTNYMQTLQQKKVAENLQPRPYYVGIYGPNNALAICYLKGLASHYWQAWSPVWNEKKNLNVWPHDNLWQVLINQADVFWVSNRAIRNCAVLGIPPEADAAMFFRKWGIDLDVAWGDPGGWKP